MKQTYPSPEKGFTLIEAAIGIAIISIIGLGMGMLMMTVTTSQMNARTRAYQENIARKIETGDEKHTSDKKKSE